MIHGIRTYCSSNAKSMLTHQTEDRKFKKSGAHEITSCVSLMFLLLDMSDDASKFFLTVIKIRFLWL